MRWIALVSLGSEPKLGNNNCSTCRLFSRKEACAVLQFSCHLLNMFFHAYQQDFLSPKLHFCKHIIKISKIGVLAPTLLSSANFLLLALLAFRRKKIMTHLLLFSSAIHSQVYPLPSPKQFTSCSIPTRSPLISLCAAPLNLIRKSPFSGFCKKTLATPPSSSPSLSFLSHLAILVPVSSPLLLGTLSMFFYSLSPIPPTAWDSSLSHSVPSPYPYLSSFASHIQVS